MVLWHIHSKSEKVCGTAFSVKKNWRKSVEIWASFLGHFGSFLGHFGQFWVIFGPLRGIFGKICGKFKFFCGIVGVQILAFRMYVYFHHHHSWGISILCNYQGWDFTAAFQLFSLPMFIKHKTSFTNADHSHLNFRKDQDTWEGGLGDTA